MGYHYQLYVTGQDYEEQFELGGNRIQVDGGPTLTNGYLVEAKFTGGEESQWAGSPYNPANGMFDVDKRVQQVQRLLDLNYALGGRGVRFVASNQMSTLFFRAFFSEWFPDQMRDGTLAVYHVPIGDGMTRPPRKKRR